MRKTKKFECFRHAKTRLRYHIIFSTKYRHMCLEPMHDDLMNCMIDVSKKQKTFEIEYLEIDKDHIHFLMRIDPKESISNVIKLLKQHSTYMMYEQHYEYLRQFYWKQHHLWTRGYFCCTIGDCSRETIKNYILNQG